MHIEGPIICHCWFLFRYFYLFITKLLYGATKYQEMFSLIPWEDLFFTQYKIHAEMSQKYTDFVKKNVTFDFLVLGCWTSIGNKPSILFRSSLNSSMIGSRTKKLRFFYGEILAIFSYFAHIFLIHLHRKKIKCEKKLCNWFYL